MLNRRFLVVTCGLLVAGTMFGSGTVAAQCARLDSSSLYFGGTIGILHDPTLPTEVVAAAVSQWGKCSNYSSGFPEFLAGQRGTRNVRVEYQPDAVGKYKCGSFRGSRIELYGQMRDRRGRLHSCGSISQNLAHELGHVLGLADAPRDARCGLHVMSWINSQNTHSRGVRPEECVAVGQTWMTDMEWNQYSGASSPDEVRRFTHGLDW